jgi:hypothetical protein
MIDAGRSAKDAFFLAESKSLPAVSRMKTSSCVRADLCLGRLSAVGGCVKNRPGTGLQQALSEADEANFIPTVCSKGGKSDAYPNLDDEYGVSFVDFLADASARCLDDFR